MIERGIELSDTVAQLVADARRQEGMSMDELAERAGVHRTYIGLLERRSRQPTLAVAANLAEALGLSLSELVAEAEQDVGNGDEPGEEPSDDAGRRHAEHAHIHDGTHLRTVTGLKAETVGRAIELAYRKLDVIDEQFRESGSPALAKLVEISDLSPLVANVLSAGIARASGGMYVQNGPDHSPSLLPLRQGLPEIEVTAALETNRLPSGRATRGVYLAFRYVLADREGSFTRGKDARGDTIAVWEARFGELGEGDFHVTGEKTGKPTARLKKEALEGMDLVYYDPALLPYAKPTGEYARLRSSDASAD
jgi:transcriptional regulator with XRE-family HTH domain